jgi:hypothetical protein
VSFYAAWAYVVHRDFWGSLFDVGSTVDKIVRFMNTNEYVYSKMIGSSSFEISGIGMWIFGGIEALAFLTPVFFTSSVFREYFCERCEKFNTDKKFYIDDEAGDAIFQSAEFSGNFNDIAHLRRRTEVPAYHERPGSFKAIYEVEVSCCPSCKKNGVVNIQKGHYKTDEKKKTISFEGKDFIKHTLVDDFSIAALAGDLFTGTPK